MSREFRAYFLTILFLIVAAFAWLTFLPANAATALCGPRKQVIDGFKSSYGEKQAWVGKPIENNGTALLLLSSDHGTWTLIQVGPDVACVLAAGTNSAFGVPA